MSARVIDIKRVRDSISARVEAALPGVLTHWENQNQPPPATAPYVSLLVTAGPAFVSVVQEESVQVIQSVDFVVPAVLPVVGTSMRIRMDYNVAEQVVTGGDDTTSIRDALLAQCDVFPEVGFGLYSFVAVGGDTIRATSAELGGIIQSSVFGGIIEANEVLVDAMELSGQANFTVRFTCYGLSSTSSTDLSALGTNSPESLWSTLQAKMQRSSFQGALLADGISAQVLWPTGSAIPANLGAGIEPRCSGSVVFATKAVDFEPLPTTLREIRGTVSASAPLGAVSATATITATPTL